MKRGRKSQKEEIENQIIDILSNTQTPLTTSSIKMLISRKFDKNFSWNSIQKYLNELVKDNQVSFISLPHSKIKDRTGITVYMLKK